MSNYLVFQYIFLKRICIEIGYMLSKMYEFSILVLSKSLLYMTQFYL